MAAGLVGCFVRRSAVVALSLVLTLMAAVPLYAQSEGDGGAIGGGEGTCQLTLLECSGVGDPLNGSDTIGVVGGAPGCQGGRIVDVPAEQSDAIPYCPDNDGDGIADLPPTHGEIVTSVCPAAPPPTLRTSPTDTGITGLDTWYWSAGPHTTSASGSIRGYPVNCTLTAAQFTLDTGDTHAAEFGHRRTHTSTTPGHDGPDTDITHLYERTGTYTLRLTITWTRATSAGTDQTTSTTTRTYPVAEVITTATTPSR